jgi:hypothetical protein
MQQIINEVQVQCGGNNIALMQTKVTCEALSDMTMVCMVCPQLPLSSLFQLEGTQEAHIFSALQ